MINDQTFRERLTDADESHMFYYPGFGREIFSLVESTCGFCTDSVGGVKQIFTYKTELIVLKNITFYENLHTFLM